MIPVLGLCGAANSGKTTLLCGVIAHLTAQGLKVGALKHHGHREPLAPPPGREGKDSARLLAAGAARVGFVHAGALELSAGPAEAGLTPAELAARYMAGLDLVLVEGYKSADIDKIEVVAPGRAPLMPPGGRLLALARRGGTGVEAGLPVLDANQPPAVARFILDHLASARPLRVSLTVGGVELDLNPFVARILDNTLRGLVGSLKGGQAGRTASIEVKLV